MQPGLRLGDRYALGYRIGAGPQCSVWYGHDTTLDRPVRIKVLDESAGADETVRAAFRQSSLAVAALNVGDVIDVFDCVEHREDGAVTMCQIAERVEGVPLDEWMRKQPARGTDEILSVVAAAAGAVQEAREAGVRHLNLKPANLIVAADGSVTVIDFGYLPLPVRGPYTAPEQPAAAAPGNTADVYALGAIAFECLTGGRFLGTNPATALPPETPGAIASLIERALAPEPSHRFGSPGALAAECQQAVHTGDVLGALLARDHTVAIESEPVPALRDPVTPPPATEPTAPGRKRLAVLAAVAVAVVVGIALTVSTLVPGGAATGQADDGGSGGPVVDDDGAVAPTTMSPTTSASGESSGGATSGEATTSSAATRGSTSSPTPVKSDDSDPPEPPDTATVPDVVGDSRDAATETLSAAGFDVDVTTSGEGAYECPVHDQNPDGGSEAEKGSTVGVELRLAADSTGCSGDGGQTSTSHSDSFNTGNMTQPRQRPAISRHRGGTVAR